MISEGASWFGDVMEEIVYVNMRMEVHCKLLDGTMLDGKVLKIDNTAEPLTIALQDTNTGKVYILDGYGKLYYYGEGCCDENNRI